MPSQTPAAKADAKRAFNLSAKIKAGKPVPQEDYLWLARYKQKAGKAMPVAPGKGIGPGPRTVSPAVQGVPAPPPMDPADTAPSLPSSAEPGPVPADASVSDASSVPPSFVTGESTPHATRESKPDKPVVVTYSADQVALAGTLSEAYCGFLHQAGALLRDAGFMAMPDELVTAIVKPAAFRLALKAIPADTESEAVDIGIVAGSSAFTAVQVVRMKRGAKPAREEKPVTPLRSVPMDSRPAAATSPDDAPPYKPTPLEAPPVDGDPSGPTTKRKRTI